VKNNEEIEKNLEKLNKDKKIFIHKKN